ncbi:hypothetical protein ACPW7J_09425 [Ihubacter sp. rT4E-8]|uniref:hypothetical protein n=1 Tax=Ihubacter sp. rT4E-8 TaxID=3242369 RepID=UPI003CF7E72A
MKKKKGVVLILICCICVFICGCGNRTTGKFISDLNSLIQEHFKEMSIEEDVSIDDKEIELSYNEESESYILEYNGNIGGMFKFFNNDNQVLSEQEIKSLPVTQIHIIGACNYDSDSWYAAELTGSTLIDYLDDNVDGYVDSLNKYWKLFVDACNDGKLTEEKLESKMYGKCDFVITKDHSFVISFDNEDENE